MSDHENTNNRLKEITDSIEAGILDLFQSDKYRQYLRIMSRFHHYSVNNTILIAMQRPDATLVAGFGSWRDQFGRSVIRGEKGIKIIAPASYKKKIERQKLDSINGSPVLDAEGQALNEDVEVMIPIYKVVSVFDVAQTEGKPLPQIANTITGDVKHYKVLIEALQRTSPVPITLEAITENMDGYFSIKNQRIVIRAGMSQTQTILATVHEITHATLHNYEQAHRSAVQGEKAAESPRPKDRRTEEIEAESVSYAVCQYYGIQTEENSFGYIASWSRGRQLTELRASLETINRTASDLIDKIDRNFVEITKNRGADMTKPDKTVACEQTDSLKINRKSDIPDIHYTKVVYAERRPSIREQLRESESQERQKTPVHKAMDRDKHETMQE